MSLKDALKTIEIDNKYNKGHYIASLCYLEMYDIENAEKHSHNNIRLKSLIEKKKKDTIIKTRKYKSYPLIINFLKELYKYNSFFPKLEIYFYTDNYRGVTAKNDISRNEIIMSIPKECLISLETALNTSYGKKIEEIMYKELNSPNNCLLSSFLLYEERNQKYKYYFDLLPKDFSNFPIFYQKKELEYLKGSPLLQQIMESKEDLKKDYNKLCEILPNFNQFPFTKFCKTRILISSRVFGISMNGKKTDVLVPFADLLNHKRPKQTQWYYDDKLESFVIESIENIKQGCEIFDSYGKKTNARFLLNYGFCLDDNDSFEYLLNVSFDEKCPLFENKLKIFFKNESEYYYKINRIFSINNNFYESQIVELLSFLRFILFEGDINKLYKIVNFSNEKKPEINNNFYIPAITKELEIKVLKYLHSLCENALLKYPTSFEQDQNLYNNKNISFNLRNCTILLMNEKTVLTYYIYFCKYCLGLLKLKSHKEVINKISIDYKYNECQFNCYIEEVILKLFKNDK